jgi:Na+-driven multidrug efflux pump
MNKLTYKGLFELWYPLAIAWIMISAEGPFLAAIVARLDAPRYNLAAYGISITLAMLTEALIIMLLSTSTVFVTSKLSYYRVRIFTFILTLSSTSILILFSIKPVFEVLAAIINLPAEVSSLANVSITILIPWPAAIGFRRFYQGILIKNGKTNLIALTTITRIVTIIICAFSLMNFTKLPGVYIAAIALSSGVTLEAIITRLFSHYTIKKILQQDILDINPPELSSIFKFYYPLALTPIIGMSTSTLITFFLGRSNYAIESLATMPVVGSFSFLFASTCYAYMELVIANLDKELNNLKKIRNFAFIIGLTVAILYSSFVFSKAGIFYFHKVTALSDYLLPFALVGSKILFFLPIFSAITSVQRGTLIFLRKTFSVSSASLIELITIFISLLLFIQLTEFAGIVAATFSLNIGRLTGIIYLTLYTNKLYKNRATTSP